MRYLRPFNENIRIKDSIDTLNEISDIFLSIEDEFDMDHFSTKFTKKEGDKFVRYRSSGEISFTGEFLPFGFDLTTTELFSIDSKLKSSPEILIKFVESIISNTKRVEDQLGLKVISQESAIQIEINSLTLNFRLLRDESGFSFKKDHIKYDDWIKSRLGSIPIRNLSTMKNPSLALFLYFGYK